MIKLALWTSLLLALCSCSSQHSTDNDSKSAKLQTADPNLSQDSLSVGTLNMAIGFDVTSLIGAVNSDSSTVYNLLLNIDSTFDASHPYERISMMADSLARKKLDVIALQEVLHLEGTRVGNGRVDFLSALVDSIAAKGGPKYQKHLLIMNPMHLVMPAVDAQLKPLAGLKTADLNFAEGNALLVKEGIEVLSQDSLRFKSMFGPLYFRTLGLKFFSERGALGLRVRKNSGRIHQVWSTHLEVELGSIPMNQTQELLDGLDQKRKNSETQIVLGDWNFAPGKGGAAMMVASDALVDSWDYAKPGTSNTCCQIINDSVSADKSSRRIDYVFFRDALHASQVQSTWIGPVPYQQRWLYGADHALVSAQIHSQY